MIGPVEWCTALGWAMRIQPGMVTLTRAVHSGQKGRPRIERVTFADLSDLTAYVNAPREAA